MESVEIQKIRGSLTSVIDKWLCDVDNSALDTYVSERIAELMANAAFSVLLAQADLTRYYEREDMLK